MSTSLPERTDLDQLRRQAKELRDAARSGDSGALERFARHHGATPHGPVTLASAQLVVARELGFASWPRLKAAVEALATARDQREAFVAAAVERRMREAEAILDADPSVASHSLNAAAVLGDARTVSETLAADPSAAVAIDEGRGWPPLLYVCYSRWHEIDPPRAAGMAAVVRLLLDAGASPNTNDGRYRSALKGSVEVNNPAITRVLLEAGANPDDPQAVSLLAEALRVATGDSAQEASEALPDAAANASREVVAALLAAGADPDSRDQEGFSSLRRAMRAGKNETSAQLIRYGAPDDSTDIDRFIGACLRADRSAAEQVLAEHPDLRDRLTDDDRAAVVEAAGSGHVGAVALMLDLGFSPHDRNGFGEQPLHTAAYDGEAEVVRLLIDAGAELDARDANFDGTPLAYATVGSGERAGQPGNWIGTVRLLVEAGASRDDVWISGKPPSEEVISLLRSYGVTPDDESEPQREDTGDIPLSIGTGVMADIAQHLEAAYRNLDLELLGSLLHPQVRWTGDCNTSAQVLDWYRRLLADGTRPTVESVEVDRDAVVLGITAGWPAEGARPAPAELLYQVFTVDDAQVVEIRGYPDRASALTRA